MRRLAALVGLATVIACGGSGSDVSGPFDAVPFAGNYAGNWHNNTFGTTGPATLTIAADPQTKTGTVGWNLDGNVLGGGDPPAESFNATWNDNGLTFSGSSVSFGDISINLNKDGEVTGHGENLPNQNIQSIDFQGSGNPNQFTINYTVHFSVQGGGGDANGTLTVTRQ